MGIHRIVKTVFAENKNPDQLPMEEFLKHIEETARILRVEIIQGVIEFHPITGYWVLYTQEILPFDIGGKPQQEYNGARLSEAYAKVRASGSDEIPRL